VGFRVLNQLPYRFLTGQNTDLAMHFLIGSVKKIRLIFAIGEFLFFDGLQQWKNSNGGGSFRRLANYGRFKVFANKLRSANGGQPDWRNHCSASWIDLDQALNRQSAQSLAYGSAADFEIICQSLFSQMGIGSKIERQYTAANLTIDIN
jgi:hypothetical protein